MYAAKRVVKTSETQGKLAYIHMAVVSSSLVQRNLCIEQIILIETKTFIEVCLTHVCDTDGLCSSVSLVSKFRSSYIICSTIFCTFCFPASI